MDRPARKTKVVSYSEDKDFDDDDDFACVKPPPSKKARDGVKQEHKKSSSKSSNQESSSQSPQSQTSRTPLDDKVYERALEAAITLSLLNNGITDKCPNSTDVKHQVPVDENTDPTSLHRSNCSVDLTVLGLDEITSEKQSLSLPRQTKAETRVTEQKKKKLTHEDEDFEPKATPDSESDDDYSEPAESEDEEFTVKKVSKTKKKEKVIKNERTKSPPASKKTSKQPKPKPQAAAATTPVRSPPTAKPAPRTPTSVSTVTASKSASPLSPAGGRIPKWNPPAQVGRSPTSSSPAVKSPGQGLRLGLSRRVRVKPLHPSVASH